MAERRFTGIDAPLVEDDRANQNVVYLFAEIVTRDELRELGKELAGQVSSMGILVDGFSTNPFEPTFVLVNLNRQSLSMREINDLQALGQNNLRFKGMRITTESDVGDVDIPDV